VVSQQRTHGGAGSEPPRRAVLVPARYSTKSEALSDETPSTLMSKSEYPRPCPQRGSGQPHLLQPERQRRAAACLQEECSEIRRARWADLCERRGRLKAHRHSGAHASALETEGRRSPVFEARTKRSLSTHRRWRLGELVAARTRQLPKSSVNGTSWKPDTRAPTLLPRSTEASQAT